MREEGHYFRISEVVKATKVGNTTIRRWIEKRKIKAFQMPGLVGCCKWVIPASEVERLRQNVALNEELICQGIRTDGKPCRAKRMAGSRFCYQHRNQDGQLSA
jgi:excisionase family DNA binding protein